MWKRSREGTDIFPFYLVAPLPAPPQLISLGMETNNRGDRSATHSSKHVHSRRGSSVGKEPGRPPPTPSMWPGMQQVLSTC